MTRMRWDKVRQQSLTSRAPDTRSFRAQTTAKFDGTCSLCGKKYRVGNQISLMLKTEARTYWGHSRCVRSATDEQMLGLRDFSPP